MAWATSAGQILLDLAGAPSLVFVSRTLVNSPATFVGRSRGKCLRVPNGTLCFLVPLVTPVEKDSTSHFQIRRVFPKMLTTNLRFLFFIKMPATSHFIRSCTLDHVLSFGWPACGRTSSLRCSFIDADDIYVPESAGGYFAKADVSFPGALEARAN